MTADSQVTSLARGTGVNLLGASISALTSIGLVVVVTNYARPSVAGAFFSMTSAFLLVSAICELGTDAGLSRWLARSLALGRSHELGALLRVALVPVATVGIVLALVTVAVAGWVGGRIGGAPHSQLTLGLILLALALPLSALGAALLSATRGLGTMLPTVLGDKVGRGSLQLAGIAVAAATGGGLVALSVAFALPYLAVAVAAAVWLAALLRREHRVREHRVQPQRARPAAATVRGDFWSYTWPRAVARVCQIALQRVDIILVAVLRSPTEAALYTVATRFLVIGQLAVQAVQNMLQPQLSGLFAREETARARRLFATATAWTMALTWPVYLASAALAPLVLGVFGGRYAGAEPVMILLAGAMLFAAACGPVDVVLLMVGRSRLSLLNNASALAVNVALNVVLIPAVGILGAAVAWAAATIVRNVLPLVQVRRSLGMSPVGRASRWVAVSAVLCFGVIPLATRLTGSDVGLLESVFWLFTGSVLYLALLRKGRRLLDLDALRRGAARLPSAAKPATVVGG